jgi:hypothetical protein
MSVHIGTGRGRGRQFVGALLSILVGLAVVGPSSAALAADGPPGQVGALLEVDIKPNSVVKVKMGICQGEISLVVWLEVVAYFVPKSGCRSTAIQYWYKKRDNSLDWSPEDKGTYRDVIGTRWFVHPDDVLRVVVTVEDTTGVRGRVWANTPQL